MALLQPLFWWGQGNRGQIGMRRRGEEEVSILRWGVDRLRRVGFHGEFHSASSTHPPAPFPLRMWRVDVSSLDCSPVSPCSHGHPQKFAPFTNWICAVHLILYLVCAACLSLTVALGSSDTRSAAVECSVVRNCRNLFNLALTDGYWDHLLFLLTGISVGVNNLEGPSLLGMFLIYLLRKSWYFYAIKFSKSSTDCKPCGMSLWDIMNGILIGCAGILSVSIY